MTITPPAQGEPVEQLWRKVAELTKVVNALANAEVRVTDTFQLRDPTGYLIGDVAAFKGGKVTVDGENAVIILQ